MNNTFRTFLLMLLLTLLFVWIGGEIGGTQGAFMAFLAAAAMNFIAYWFSDKLLFKRYQAHELKPGDQSRLYSIVEDLSKKANIPIPRVYIIPQQTPNAFATWKSGSCPYVYRQSFFWRVAASLFDASACRRTHQKAAQHRSTAWDGCCYIINLIDHYHSLKNVLISDSQGIIKSYSVKGFFRHINCSCVWCGGNLYRQLCE